MELLELLVLLVSLELFDEEGATEMGFAEGDNVADVLVGAVVEGVGEMGFAEGDDVMGALVGAD